MFSLTSTYIIIINNLCELLITITGSTLGLPIHVFGPETHMTSIVAMALGKRPIPKQEAVVQSSSQKNVITCNLNMHVRTLYMYMVYINYSIVVAL